MSASLNTAHFDFLPITSWHKYFTFNHVLWVPPSHCLTLSNASPSIWVGLKNLHLQFSMYPILIINSRLGLMYPHKRQVQSHPYVQPYLKTSRRGLFPVSCAWSLTWSLNFACGAFLFSSHILIYWLLFQHNVHVHCVGHHSHSTQHYQLEQLTFKPCLWLLELVQGTSTTCLLLTLLEALTLVPDGRYIKLNIETVSAWLASWGISLYLIVSFIYFTDSPTHLALPFTVTCDHSPLAKYISNRLSWKWDISSHPMLSRSESLFF